MNPRSGCRDSQCDGFTAAVRRHQFLAGNDFPVAVETGLCRHGSRVEWQLADVIVKSRSRPFPARHQRRLHGIASAIKWEDDGRKRTWSNICTQEEKFFSISKREELGPPGLRSTL